MATAKGRRIGRPILVDQAKLDYAAHLRDRGHTIAEIVEKTGITRTSNRRQDATRRRRWKRHFASWLT